MSRGRGGPSKEQNSRSLPAHLPPKQYYSQTDPSTPHQRAPHPLQVPRPNDFSCPGNPVGPFPSPDYSRFSSTPPVPYNNQVSSVKVGNPNTSINQNLRSNTEPSSFLSLQAQFVRGQSSEAQSSPQAAGGTHNDRAPFSPHKAQSGYGRYPRSGPRGRGNNRRNRVLPNTSGGGAPRTFASEDWNPSQAHTATHGQHSNRHLCRQSDSLVEDFHGLTVHRDRSNSGRGNFDSASVSSSSIISSSSKVNLPLTPNIQEGVYSILAALSPSENIAARPLAKRLRLPKKIVNSTLYSLEASGKAFKKGTHPPLWSLYRQLSGDQVFENNEPGGSLAQLCNFSEHSQQTIKLEVKTEAVEALEQLGEDLPVREDCSDTESTSSRCSSFESSASDLSSTPTTSSTIQDIKPAAAMANQKEQILHYLFQVPDVTALVIAKNVGLNTAKQVNTILYNMEMQGELTKNSEVKPPTWELSKRRREKMERSLKASQGASTAMQCMEEGAGSTPLPLLLPGLEPSLLQDSRQPLQGIEAEAGSLLKTEEQSTGGHCLRPASDQEMAPALSAATPANCPPSHPRDDEANGEQWATDDIPEFLNAIRRQTDTGNRTEDVGTVAVSLAAPPPQNQWAKLQEVRLKNPVSGLMEYAQYLGQSCEFVLLDQSGPSHDPR